MKNVPKPEIYLATSIFSLALEWDVHLIVYVLSYSGC